MSKQNHKGRYIPHTPICPGDLLEEELEERGWTQGDFADVIGRPIQLVNQIIKGKKAITPQTAREFSSALGTSPEYWLNLENAYRLDLLASQADPDGTISRRSALYSMAPITEMLKRNWIEVDDPHDLDELEGKVCSFFGVSNVSETPRLGVSARQSLTKGSYSTSQIAWMFRAKNLAEEKAASEYSRKKLLADILDLRKLCIDEEETKRVPAFLAKHGVRFVVVEHLPQTKIDGAALWIDAKKPVIALSLRYDRLDSFWFTLLHEIGHIIHEDHKDGFHLDEDIFSTDCHRENQEFEDRANDFAATILIKKSELEAFVAKTKPYYSRKKILRFAEEQSIHPSILVGQLQYRNEIPYSHSRALHVKVKPILQEVMSLN